MTLFILAGVWFIASLIAAIGLAMAASKPMP